MDLDHIIAPVVILAQMASINGAILLRSASRMPSEARLSAHGST